MAPAPSVRSRASSPPRWLWWALAAGVVAVGGYLLWQRSAGTGGKLDSSGTPGPGRASSAAQEPSGGAGNVPGNLPLDLISHPDALQQQVQTSDAGSSVAAESPTSSGSSFAYSNDPNIAYTQQQMQLAGLDPATVIYAPRPAETISSSMGSYTAPSGSITMPNYSGYNPVAAETYQQMGRKLEVPV